MQRMAGRLSPTGDERSAASPPQRSAANLEVSSPPSGDNSGRSPFNRPCAPATGLCVCVCPNYLMKWNVSAMQYLEKSFFGRRAPRSYIFAS